MQEKNIEKHNAIYGQPTLLIYDKMEKMNSLTHDGLYSSIIDESTSNLLSGEKVSKPLSKSIAKSLA